MIILLLLLAVLFIFLVGRFVMLGQQSRVGQTPGLANGKLTYCPATPNCVCSEFPEDASHRVNAIQFTPDGANNLPIIIKKIISDMQGKIVKEQDNYLAATFSSALFGFVDDFEVRIDPQARQIHLRSASRVGKSDLGVNRKRVEAFRKQLLLEIAVQE